MQTVFKRQFLTLFLAQFLIGTDCSQQTRVWVLSAFSLILHLVTLVTFSDRSIRAVRRVFLAFLLISFENATKVVFRSCYVSYWELIIFSSFRSCISSYITEFRWCIDQHNNSLNHDILRHIRSPFAPCHASMYIGSFAWLKYRLDDERECSMGNSVPSIDRRPRGPKARVAFYLCEGHYIP